MSPQQTAAQEAANFVATFNDIILFPFITLLMAVSFLVFVVGCVQYFINSASEEGRRTGLRHITYGIIGLVVMVSAWGILSIVAGTFGLGDELDCAKDPSASGCANVFNP